MIRTPLSPWLVLQRDYEKQTVVLLMSRNPIHRHQQLATSELLNCASGATWVSIHHGGGVGIGYSQHAGLVICCDGTDEAAHRIERVLWNDPASGIMRHADAGYPADIECALQNNLDLPAILDKYQLEIIFLNVGRFAERPEILGSIISSPLVLCINFFGIISFPT